MSNSGSLFLFLRCPEKCYITLHSLCLLRGKKCLINEFFLDESSGSQLRTVCTPPLPVGLGGRGVGLCQETFFAGHHWGEEGSCWHLVGRVTAAASGRVPCNKGLSSRNVNSADVEKLASQGNVRVNIQPPLKIAIHTLPSKCRTCPWNSAVG